MGSNILRFPSECFSILNSLKSFLPLVYDICFGGFSVEVILPWYDYVLIKIYTDLSYVYYS
jgi:hypothetical protein